MDCSSSPGHPRCRLSGSIAIDAIRILENIQQKIFARASFEFVYRFPKIKISELDKDYPPELANRFFDTLTVQKGLSKVLIDFPAAVLQIVFGDQFKANNINIPFPHREVIMRTPVEVTGTNPPLPAKRKPSKSS